MNIIISALKIIFLLGFLIFIHEGGHFLAAKFFKIKVKEFSIGFGPKIFSKQGKKETKYSVRLIPLGGFVDMLGETERKDEEGSFSSASVLQRLAIVAAGPIINILFAVIVYFMLIAITGANTSTTVDEILPEYTENLSELQVGDTILEVNGEKIRLKSDIDDIIQNLTSDESITLLVDRNGEEIYIEVTPTFNDDYGIYMLGIQVALADKSFTNNIYYAFWGTTDFVSSIGDSLKLLFTNGIQSNQVMGPIGISEVVAQSSSIANFIYLLSVISLSLGVTNLLPIPALDGGKILFLIIEGIRRKPLSEELEMSIQSLGFTFLILLSLYVSYNDIIRLF